MYHVQQDIKAGAPDPRHVPDFCLHQPYYLTKCSSTCLCTITLQRSLAFTAICMLQPISIDVPRLHVLCTIVKGTSISVQNDKGSDAEVLWHVGFSL